MTKRWKIKREYRRAMRAAALLSCRACRHDAEREAMRARIVALRRVDASVVSR